MATVFLQSPASPEKLGEPTRGIPGTRGPTIPPRKLANGLRERLALPCFRVSIRNTSRRLPGCWEPFSAAVSRSPLPEANHEARNLAADPSPAACAFRLPCSTPALSPPAVGDCRTCGDRCPQGRQSASESGNQVAGAGLPCHWPTDLPRFYRG